MGSARKHQHCPGAQGFALLAPPWQGLTRAAARPLPGRVVRGDGTGVPRLYPMASSAPLACPIRQLVLHSYPAGLKVAAAERVTVFYGRRGKPVKKPRFIPAELAHQLARKLAAKRLGTVSVL